MGLVRPVANRLLAIALLAGMLVIAAAAAVEAGSLLLGTGSQLEPQMEYTEWASTLETASLSHWEALALAGGALAAGLALLLFELWPSGRGRREGIDDLPHGRVSLRLAGLEPHLEDRLRTVDWIRRSRVRARVRGGVARVKARALSSRQTSEQDLEAVREILRASLEQVGVNPGPIELAIRQDRKTSRVQ